MVAILSTFKNPRCYDLPIVQHLKVYTTSTKKSDTKYDQIILLQNS